MFKPGDIVNKRYRILRQVAVGGFSLIFEVRDLRQRNFKNAFGLRRSRSIKILKVLNFPESSRKDAEFLFRREIGLLKQLDHPAVVKYADDFDLVHDQRIIPCLVMEKVPGGTMEKWLQEHGAVSEEVALDWLLQFTDVLDYLHNDQRVMHLDIKPANVMVTPQGELVLIDFGIARPISSTLLAKLIDSGEAIQHRAATAWFSAPEQLEGKPTSQSDFYSVGRTMICALTNLSPENINEDDEGDLNWQPESSKIPHELINLVNQIIGFDVQNRINSSARIFENLKLVKKQLSSYRIFELRKRLLLSWNTLLIITACSLITSSAINLVRHTGFFIPLDLLSYDFYIRVRPYLKPEPPDNRITIITIDTQDIKVQEDRGYPPKNNRSISDQGLLDALKIIDKYEPRLIGLDVIRDFPVDRKVPALKRYLENSDNLVAICKTASRPEEAEGENGIRVSGHSGPPEVDITQIGLFDLINDEDDIVRRHPLYLSVQDPCQNAYAFATVLTEMYLRNMKISPIFNSSNNLTFQSDAGEFLFGNNQLEDLDNVLGFYRPYGKCQDSDSKYCVSSGQMMINYRSLRNLRDVARIISLSDIYNENFEQSHIKDKILLIGVDISNLDQHRTPYRGVSDPNTISGVFIHAHVISQLLATTLDKRSGIRFANYAFEITWIYSTTFLLLSMFLVGITVGYGKSTFSFLVLTTLIFHILAFAFLSIALPLVPTAISFLISATSAFLPSLKKNIYLQRSLRFSA